MIPNNDNMVNVVDVVNVVNIILGYLTMSDGPSEAIIEIVSNELSVRGIGGAIDGVQFKFASGNIDAGTFKLYGVS